MAPTRPRCGSSIQTSHPTAYDTAGSVVETNTDDSPFLVDSVQEELLARGLGVRRLLHPVIGTIRDEQGRIERVMSGRDASHRESVMHFELDRQLAPEEADDLERRVTAILHDVRLAVRDFEPMQERVRHMIELARTAAIRYPPHEVGEAIDFLEWLAQLNFVLLGYREYELVDIDGEERAAIRAVSGSGLGILSDVQRSAFADTTRLSDLDEVVRARIEGGDLLVFSKTNSYSSVHRRARMDYIGVRVVNPEGVITGEARLIGLFTSKAYMEPAAKTPLLHAKLEQILAAEDLIPGSHDYKESVELFESFPKDELFQASTEELRGSWWACCSSRSTAASGCWCAATSTAAVSRSWWRCLVIGSTRRCASACSSTSCSSSTGPRSTITSRSVRPNRPASSSRCTCFRARTSPMCPTSSWRPRSSGSPAAGTTTCETL